MNAIAKILLKVMPSPKLSRPELIDAREFTTEDQEFWQSLQELYTISTQNLLVTDGQR